jgi:hypothetical protein
LHFRIKEKIMTFLKIAFVACTLLLNLIFAPFALADAGKFMKSPDYQMVSQKIDDLLQTKANLKAGESSDPINQKLTALLNQKYILETAAERASCSNQTGKTLGVYLQSKKAAADVAPTLYYLGDGDTTDDELTCKGVYLPTGTNVAFSLLDPAQSLSQPLAATIVEGTRLAVKTNAETGAVEFNLPPAEVLKAGEAALDIPSLQQTDIDAQKPNAPSD